MSFDKVFFVVQDLMLTFIHNKIILMLVLIMLKKP